MNHASPKSTLAGTAAPLAAAIAIVCIWFTLLFAGPTPPDVLLAAFPTLVSGIVGAVALILLATGIQLRPSPVRDVPFLALALAIFGIPLVGMWHGGPAGPNVLVGLLPLLDAAGYETGGLMLADLGRLDSWNSRRPLTAAMLGVLFAVNEGNLQWTQSILVLINAVAVFAAARVVWRSHGLAAGLLVVVSLYVFFSEHLGSLLSENLGLALGAAAFALLWEGVRSDRRWLLSLGLFTLSLGLNARAGAFFVLPLLIIWLAWCDRSRGWTHCAGTFAWAVGAGLLGFVPGAILVVAYAPSDHVPFGNFAPTLYGLAVGGKGWTQVFADHPQINAMLTAQEIYREIFRLALASARDAPELLLLGVARGYNEYLFNTGWHDFFENRIVRGMAILLTLAGLVDCIRRRREKDAAFLLVVTAGVFASVPFLADGGPRVYAATIPVTAALIGSGALVLARWARRPVNLINERQISPVPAVLIVALIVALTGPAVPLAAGSLRRPPPEAHSCGGVGDPAIFVHRPGAFVLVSTESPRDARLPHVRSTNLLEKFPLPDLIGPAYLSRGRERLSGRWGWFVVNEYSEGPTKATVRMCGQWREGGVFVGKSAPAFSG